MGSQQYTFISSPACVPSIQAKIEIGRHQITTSQFTELHLLFLKKLRLPECCVEAESQIIMISVVSVNTINASYISLMFHKTGCKPAQWTVESGEASHE